LNVKRIDWLLTGLAVSAGLVALAIYERNLVIGACGGEYIYPIDDTYIHIAMAKCLASDGTWGVEPGKMAFCSSSPLWTLLLGGLYRLFGVSEGLPWHLALVFNVGLVFAVCRLFASMRLGMISQAMGAVLTAMAGPVLCTTALGMEHAMHAFFIVAVLAAVYGMTRGSRRCAVAAPIFAAAATSSRYESLFLLLPVGCVVCGFEAYGQWKNRQKVLPVTGLAFLFATILPVVLYGTWAMASGGHFFPNSLLLKGGFRAPSELFEKAIQIFGSVAPEYGFLYLLAAALVAVAVLPQTSPVWRSLAVCVVIAIGGQMLFAAVGQLCRYEAFLTSAAMLVIVAAVAESGLGPFPMAALPLGVVTLTAGMFLLRARGTFHDAVRSSSDICNQQVLMTRILSEMPEGERGCVALNDLGYMALHGKFPILDIWGLGSQDATELILENGKTRTLEANEILFKKHKVRYAAVFESWFPASRMPEGTIDVAYLKLRDNFACGSDTVVFRATSEADADRLERHLRKFDDKLPPRASMQFCR